MEGLSKFVSKSFEQCIKSSDRVQEFLNTMTQNTQLPSKLIYIEENINNKSYINGNININNNNNNENKRNPSEDNDDNSDTIDIDITDVSDLNGTLKSIESPNEETVPELRPLSLVKYNKNNKDKYNNNNIEDKLDNSNSNDSYQRNSSKSPELAEIIRDELICDQEEVEINQNKEISNGSHKNQTIGNVILASNKTKNWLVSDSSKENHFEHCNQINVDGKEII